MAIMNYLRKMLKRQASAKPMEYVRADRCPVNAMAHPPVPENLEQPEAEIDLTHQADLEGYARGLSVSKESIERWISSGLLMPQEMQVAEKLVKIMNKH